MKVIEPTEDVPYGSIEVTTSTSPVRVDTTTPNVLNREAVSLNSLVLLIAAAVEELERLNRTLTQMSNASAGASQKTAKP